jgi:hypothetical protein
MGEQGDLFGGGRWVAGPAVGPAAIDAKLLDNAGLVAAVAHVSLADCAGVLAEVRERRLVAAVPELEALCARFKGFGLERPVLEQVGALETLGVLGGPQAREAVGRVIASGLIAEPGMGAALAAAVAVGARLPFAIVMEALGSGEPGRRADGCRLARVWPKAAPRLVVLLEDLHGEVAAAAAVTLGLMGRAEAKGFLLGLLGKAPSVEVVEAVAAIGEDDCFVALGRVARRYPGLLDAVRLALAEQVSVVAARVLRGLG